MVRVCISIRGRSPPDSKFSSVMPIRSNTSGEVCEGTTMRALAHSSASFLWSRAIRTHRTFCVGRGGAIEETSGWQLTLNFFVSKVHTSLVPGQLFRHCLKSRTNLYDEEILAVIDGALICRNPPVTCPYGSRPAGWQLMSRM
jgi:hypothetical protein